MYSTAHTCDFMVGDLPHYAAATQHRRRSKTRHSRKKPTHARQLQIVEYREGMPDIGSSPNMTKIILGTLLAVLGGGGWGTLSLQSLTEEIRQVRKEVNIVRSDQQTQHSQATSKIAVLESEVRGMRRDIERFSPLTSTAGNGG